MEEGESDIDENPIDILQLEAYRDYNKASNIPLNMIDNAILRDDFELFKRYLDRGVPFNKTEYKIAYIMKFGDYDIALTLIKNGYENRGWFTYYLINRALEKGRYGDISIIVNNTQGTPHISLITYEHDQIKKLTQEQLENLILELSKTDKFPSIFPELSIAIINHYPIEDFNLLLMNYTPDETTKMDLLYSYSKNNLSCEKLRYIINAFQMPVEETMNILQGYQPNPICEGYPIYSSKRGKVMPQTLPALGFAPPNKRVIRDKLLTDFRIDNECFCLNAKSGILMDVYLPVIRYGKSTRSGFYGGSHIPNTEKIDFTWYYIEPESGIYLHCPRLLVAKNKVAASFYLAINFADQEVIDDLFEEVKSELELSEEINDMDWKRFVELMLDEKVVHISKNYDNYFNVVASSEANRFPPGAFDFLDEFITNYSRDNNIQVIALTHEQGYGRMVSECVDNRLREESFASLYRIE